MVAIDSHNNPLVWTSPLNNGKVWHIRYYNGKRLLCGYRRSHRRVWITNRSFPIKEDVCSKCLFNAPSGFLHDTGYYDDRNYSD